MVPVRATFEALGARVGVGCDGNTRSVTAETAGLRVVLKIDSSDTQVNGEEKKLDVPAQIVNGRTLVPLRFVAEALGDRVSCQTQ